MADRRRLPHHRRVGRVPLRRHQSWAQRPAGPAAPQWDPAQPASQTTAVEYHQAAARGAPQAPFVDPGAEGRESAKATLARARTRLTDAGDIAARSVASTVFSPGGLIVAGGAGLTAVSALGEVGGAALDATGIGAVIGVPANVVSAAGITAGVGLMAAGMARGDKDNYSRPSGHRKGMRDSIWNSGKKDAAGDNVDPNTGKKLDPKRWDAGHKDQTFKGHQEDARGRGLNRKEFLDEHNQSDHYHPEDPSSNRSRRHDK